MELEEKKADWFEFEDSIIQKLQGSWVRRHLVVVSER